MLVDLNMWIMIKCKIGKNMRYTLKYTSKTMLCDIMGYGETTVLWRFYISHLSSTVWFDQFAVWNQLIWRIDFNSVVHDFFPNKFSKWIVKHSNPAGTESVPCREILIKSNQIFNTIHPNHPCVLIPWSGLLSSSSRCGHSYENHTTCEGFRGWKV